jgi:hypothetical protein
MGVGQTERIDVPGFLTERADWTADGCRFFLPGSLEGGVVRSYLFDPQTKEHHAIPPDLRDVKSVLFHRRLGLVLARSIGGR